MRLVLHAGGEVERVGVAPRAAIAGISAHRSPIAIGFPSPPSSRAGYCAWTHPAGEFRAELDLMAKGFAAYLPLHLERGAFKAQRETHEPRAASRSR